ncbi:hypothetical protein GCM10023187_30220 [Nibrella viscosa]|uniref:Uncharacterized protein n=1 Tax=Nibrella viscosa TaxID=1084524 RepID=A0ABP8KJX1_9BACT
MYENREHLQTLTEIRSLMERSSKFLSLSGLSGVSAGVIALIGAGIAYVRLQTDWLSLLAPDAESSLSSSSRRELLIFLLADGLIVLVLALATGIFFTVRKARQHGQTVWNATSQRLLWALAVPLVAGGVFCIGMVYHNLIWLIFPATLIFYGLALLNAGKHTHRDVEYLGMSEIALGLVALFLTGYSLLTWAIGFGLLNIAYGTVMYYKYEKPAS